MKHKRSYFLSYELEKVKKEEVDFSTSRHEQVNWKSCRLFKGGGRMGECNLCIRNSEREE